MAGGETRVIRVLDWVGHRNRRIVLAVGAMLLLLVFALDYLSGPELSFSIAYLLPVAFLAWYVGRRAAIVCALLAAALWLAADLLSGHRYSHVVIPYWNGLVRLGFFLIFAFLLSRLRLAMERERRLARVDPLTGVANGRAFIEALHAEITRGRRFGHPFSLFYVDCDNFKEINDRRGHETGDKVLRVVAQTMVRQARRVDTVARLGGDEFAALMPETTGSVAIPVVKRIQTALLAAMAKHSWPITFSIGLATFTEPPESVDEAIRTADDLMYRAKARGKNAVETLRR